MPPLGNALALAVEPDGLRALVREVVEQALVEADRHRAAIPPGRLAFTEAEAAAMLGLEQHVLRDERRRGRIAYSRIVGNRVAYAPDDLMRYLRERRVEAESLPARRRA